MEFAKSEAKVEDESDPIYLSGLMQSWSFAAQSDNEGLLSAIPAVLALLLRTISTFIEFWEFGIKLCKTLLRRDQLKLINRGLSASKSKEFLISPCLRLLTEMVSFDGGILGKRLYLQRETTFKRLDFFLGMNKPILVEDGIAKQKPSVRLNAVHYLLANIRLQASRVKSDLISQPRLTRGLFQSIGQDLPSLTSEIIDVCYNDIAANHELSEAAKSRFFNENTLLRILQLRDHQNEVTSSELDHSVGIRAQQLLMKICSNVGVDPLVSGESKDTHEWDTLEDFRLVTRSQSSDMEGRPNSSFASFIQHIKPFSNVMDKDLILEAFRAAPALVTDYFSKKKSFSYDPKLSATWIGYSTFLYSVIELPLPERFLKAVPATTHVFMDHLLPEPLNRKSLERSLNQKHPLIKLFAARLLIKALQKLDLLISHLKCIGPDNIMNAFIPKLKAKLCQQCPEIGVIIAAYKEACNLESFCLRETLVRLISLYYATLPQMVLEDNFDISVALADRLSLENETRNQNGQKGLPILELDSYLVIARGSSEIRWWHKPGR